MPGKKDWDKSSAHPAKSGGLLGESRPAEQAGGRGGQSQTQELSLGVQTVTRLGRGSVGAATVHLLGAWERGRQNVDMNQEHASNLGQDAGKAAGEGYAGTRARP